jgi:RND family efflux transporter MFP subunit
MRHCIFFGLLLALLSAVVGCGDDIAPGTTPGKAPSAIQTRTAVATIEPRADLYQAVGTVRARQASTLAARVMGTVAAVNVVEGQYVAREAVLVTLARDQIEAGLDQARAGVAAALEGQAAAEAARDGARVQVDLANATLARFRGLSVGQAVSAQEMDEVRTRAQTAETALARAEAMLAAAARKVDEARGALRAAVATRADTHVRAPFDGLITARLVEPGDLAAPGGALVAMEAREGYRVDLPLPEAYWGAVQVGQSVPVELPALGPDPVAGTVETVVPAADSATRTILVKVGLPDLAGLRSGLFARVGVPVGRRAVLRVPLEALIHQGQLTGIFKVDAGDTARFALVRSGRVEGGRVEILSGLGDGERYVTAPGALLVDGCRVQEAP